MSEAENIDSTTIIIINEINIFLKINICLQVY